MQNLKPYSALKESDWWDNDPSAPWNQPDAPDPEAAVEYTPAQQEFKYEVGVPDWFAILRKKSDWSLWVLDTRDLLDSGGEYDDYIFYIHLEDEIVIADDMEDDSYVNIATDLYKEGKYAEESDITAIDDGENEERLYRLDETLAAWLIEDSLYWSKKREQRFFTPNRAKRYREMANFLGRAFPDIDL